MPKLFRTQNPTFSFVASILIIVLSRLSFIYHDIDISLWQNDLAPLSRFVLNLIGEDLISNKIFNLSLSGILFLLQGILLNYISNKYKLFGKTNYLPFWIYILIVHSHPYFIVFSPILIANTFLIVGFLWSIRFFQDNQSIKKTANIGLLASLAFLFWYPSIGCIGFVVVCLVLRRVFSLRVFVAYLIAVAIPFIYIFFYYFMVDDFSNGISFLFSTFHINSFEFSGRFYPMYLLHLFLGLLFLITLMSTYQYSQRVLSAVRAILSVVFIYFVMLFLGLFFQKSNFPSVIVPLLFPLAFFLTVFIHKIKNERLAEIIHLALFLSIIIHFTFIIYQV